MTFEIGIFLTTFAFIFLAELPDKSFLVTMMLSMKSPRTAVWLGASIAFGLQAAIAVTAGTLLTRLPERLVAGVVFLIFLAGAIYLFVTAYKERTTAGINGEEEARGSTSWFSAVLLTLGVVFTAEWGDITQLAAAAESARTGNPLSVGLGAWAAEVAVAGIGVVIGRKIANKIRPSVLHVATGFILIALAAVTAFEFLNA